MRRLGERREGGRDGQVWVGGGPSVALSYLDRLPNARPRFCSAHLGMSANQAGKGCRGDHWHVQRSGDACKTPTITSDDERIGPEMNC